MKVITSRIIGYCHGVSKTISLASKCVQDGNKQGVPYYSIGQLIHNRIVSDYFEQQGLKIIKTPDDVKPGIALIRAHGISDALKKQFEENGFTLIDSTCANILKTRDIIRNTIKRKTKVIIIGVKGHAETECLIGTCNKGKASDYYLITGKEELENLYSTVSENTPIVVVTQTTFPLNEYNEITKELEKHYEYVEFGNKPCMACVQRKKKALDLANKCDAMVVIGSPNSENTKDLALWIMNSGKRVFTIENAESLTPELEGEISKYKTVGLCSGTSTPTSIINEVEEHLKKL